MRVPGWIKRFSLALRPDFLANSLRTQRRVAAGLQLECLEERLVPAVRLNSSFDGLAYSDTQGFVPPDTNAAVGFNRVVEVVNSDLAIYDKATGGLLFKQYLNGFFGATGSYLPFDPLVTYDDLANRFVVVALQRDDGSQQSTLFVGVSNSSDPLGGFSTRSINVKRFNGAGQGLWGDNPRVGWNADAYVVTLNMFTFPASSAAFDHVQVVTLQKNAANVFQVDRPSASDVSNLDPARMHGSLPGGPMWFTETASLSSIRVVQMTNLLSQTPTFADYNVSVPSFSSPPNASQLGGVITTGDTRILACEYRSGHLVATHTVGNGGVAHARWYDFSVAGGSPLLIQSGEINDGSGKNTFYPSIAINVNGDLGMTFVQSASNEYLSMWVTGRRSTDAFGLMKAPQLVESGQNTYTDYTGSPYRTGDYSGISVDPSDGLEFWAANEYATVYDTDNWGTQVVSFTMIPNPYRADSVGIFSPSNANWSLRNSNTAGPPDIGPFAYGSPNWKPVVGDWYGQGVTTVGAIDPNTATWYLRNSNSSGPPDIYPFQFGSASWTPIVGNWDGQGSSLAGFVDRSTMTWYLLSSNSVGAPLYTAPFQFGLPGWIPVVGDWTGSGRTTIGAVDPNSMTWYLSKNFSEQTVDFQPFQYGLQGWVPITGDWTGSGRTTIGVVDTSSMTWFLRNSNDGIYADTIFQYGSPGSIPVVGHWIPGTSSPWGEGGQPNSRTNSRYLKSDKGRGLVGAGGDTGLYNDGLFDGRQVLVDWFSAIRDNDSTYLDGRTDYVALRITREEPFGFPRQKLDQSCSSGSPDVDVVAAWHRGASERAIFGIAIDLSAEGLVGRQSSIDGKARAGLACFPPVFEMRTRQSKIDGPLATFGDRVDLIV